MVALLLCFLCLLPCLTELTRISVLENGASTQDTVRYPEPCFDPSGITNGARTTREALRTRPYDVSHQTWTWLEQLAATGDAAAQTLLSSPKPTEVQICKLVGDDAATERLEEIRGKARARIKKRNSAMRALRLNGGLGAQQDLGPQTDMPLNRAYDDEEQTRAESLQTSNRTSAVQHHEDLDDRSDDHPIARLRSHRARPQTSNVISLFSDDSEGELADAAPRSTESQDGTSSHNIKNECGTTTVKREEEAEKVPPAYKTVADIEMMEEELNLDDQAVDDQLVRENRAAEKKLAIAKQRLALQKQKADLRNQAR